jgi:hypothetical protein
VADKVIAQIVAKKNFLDGSQSFFLQKNEIIRIQAYGEEVDYRINTSLIKSYLNDCVEFYFDMQNHKVSYFDVNGDDRQYRFIWELLKIDGLNVDTNGVEVAETDQDDITYIMKFKYPWKTLGYVTPQYDIKIGLDVALGDMMEQP